MAERKSYLLRLPADLWEQIQRSAAADLRSVNAQIELLLRESLRRRLASGPPTGHDGGHDEDQPEPASHEV
ncbi:MAG: Arc family DNA-binding protein [Fimbriimonadaceae bacterium]|nr:Arc family DNA-binding protein [Fimbriimonadaceae bacterium]